MTTDIRSGGSDMLGHRHGSETPTTPESAAGRSPTQALETPAERTATIAEHHEERQPQQMPVKLYRTADLVTVAAPMPGLGAGDIAIIVSPERRLVIVGRLCADADESCGTLKQPNKEVLLDEWNVGPYRREIDLPAAVDGTAATVTYGNGILVIALPVAEKTRPARVTLDNVNTQLRAGHAGAPNRRLGGVLGGDPAARRGAVLVAGGAVALYLLRRSPAGRGLLSLATATLGPAVLRRVMNGQFLPWRDDANEDDARKPKSPRKSENAVDEASWESFPASDPPSWTGTRARAFD